MLFGVCSNDVLFARSSDEVSQGIEGNRLARLAGHLLQQQSFSPQFPVPQNLLAQVFIVKIIIFYICDLLFVVLGSGIHLPNIPINSTTCVTRSTGSSKCTRTS